jgi:para-nitrobenzyl esterase
LKHILLSLGILVVFAFAQSSSAQSCDGQRYFGLLFPVYDSSTVVYSNNNMTMDIYQPDGDTATNRRVVMMIHGGDFYEGSSKDAFVYFICQQYAKRGFVTVSINYTLIPIDSNIFNEPILDSATGYPIIAQTISDAKAAVRYLKMNAASLRIDTSWIVIGGDASGALIADHIAYMTAYSPAVPLFDSAFAALGGLDGNSGNPGYSANVKAVLNFGGGLLNLDMITGQDHAPCYTFQSDSDADIPFECGYAFDYYANYTVCGGGAMQPVLSSLGITNQLVFFDSLDNEPWGDTVYSGPLQGRYIQSMVDSQAAVFLYQIDCPTFTAIKEITDAHISLYPNPSSGMIYIQADNAIETVDIIDYTGRRVGTYAAAGSQSNIDISRFSAGIYIARINLKDQGNAVRRFIVE